MKKTALVTGASRGIGRQTALGLAAAGFRVGLLSRTASDLTQLAGEIRSRGGEAWDLSGDLDDYAVVEGLIGTLAQAWGRLDVLVNNAGVGGFKSLEEFSPQDWDWMMNTNARGTFFTVKAALPLLKSTPGALIITVESDVARRGFDSGSLYCASKYAQEGFTQSLRKEVRKHGIRVSAVYPGLTDTSFGQTQAGAEHKKDWLKPEDVARTVVFIAQSPEYVVIDEIMIHPFCQDY